MSSRKKLTAKIPFNKPFMSGRELIYIRQAHASGHLSGGGPFTKKCEEWLKKKTNCKKAFLTHSCTAALEMAAILAEIRKGDEIIMPSYAFVSTANAFVLCGGVPVFVDIRPDTLNIDERKIESAITRKTKAIVALHYGGVSCEMDVILAIAKKYGLFVIEDAAQGILAAYKGKMLGSMGDFGVFSFHETKSIMSGEGGVLLVHDKRFINRAEIIREKGTNRSQFLRGQIDKYTWRDIGSSYLPSDIIAAFLWGQLEVADSIIQRRMELWQKYHQAFADLEEKEKLRRPIVPLDCRHNAHSYYLLLPNQKKRDWFIQQTAKRGILTLFHYVPLHNSPAGRRFSRAASKLHYTNNLSGRLVRLPLWIGIEKHISQVIDESIKLLS